LPNLFLRWLRFVPLRAHLQDERSYLRLDRERHLLALHGSHPAVPPFASVLFRCLI
jgi:hypothetical protein